MAFSWKIEAMPKYANLIVDLQHSSKLLSLGAFHEDDTAERSWSSCAHVTFL
jgi:hypothetical protein